MTRTATLAVAGLIAAHAIGCGFRQVAPPEMPAAQMPTGVEPRTTPPEAGHTRILFDANGQRAVVSEILDQTSAVSTAVVGTTAATAVGYSETAKVVCLAPCFADMKPGTHHLRFVSSADDEQRSEILVNVGDEPKIVRHAMGRVESTSAGHTVSSMMMYLGLVAAIVGGTFYGAATATGDDAVKQGSLVTLAAGGGAVLLGIPLMILTRPVSQPGATTEMPFAR